MNKNITVISDSNDIRVDKFLASKLDKSRNEIKNLLTKGKVQINNNVIKPSYLVQENDEITIIIEEAFEGKIEKKDIKIDVVYEDADVIVVNKESGMVVHPANGHYDDTLVNALMYHCTDLSTINGEIRPGIVHRIDKDTSGLLVACKNDHAHNHIAKQLKEKSSTRIYLAIVYGNFEHNFGKIDAPIARDPYDRKKMAIVEGGKEAVTHFKVLERYGDFSLLELKLETGRTHQIRVHMNYIGHPVLGDPLYGKKKNVTPFGQYLHAATLGFVHPSTNEFMEFKAEPPKEFMDKLNELRNYIK